MSDRNPIILPEKDKKLTGCPICGGDFIGRKVQGVITFKCQKLDCRNEWQGGLPREPQDPLVPLPTDTYIPPVQFHPVLDKDGNIVSSNEERRRVSTQQDFRKGLPITNDEDENG